MSEVVGNWNNQVFQKGFTVGTFYKVGDIA